MRPTVDIFGAALLGHIEDPTTNRAKDELAKSGKDLARVPFLRGSMIDVTIAATSSERLTHKLGRTPQGWIKCGVTGGPDSIYETDRNARTITLQNDEVVDITIKVWVF